MNDRMRFLLIKVHKDNSGWWPIPHRFYAGDHDREIICAEKKGWIEVVRDRDGISGDFSTLVLTSSGRCAIGAPDLEPHELKARIFEILRNFGRQKSSHS